MSIAKRFRTVIAILAVALVTLFAGMMFVGCGDAKDVIEDIINSTDKDKDKDQALTAVDASTITYDGTTIEWSAAAGANAYNINIAGVDSGNLSTFDTKYLYNAPSASNQVTISIIAKNTKGEKLESDAVVFTRLKTINKEDLTFSDTGSVTWSDVENATGYVVRLNGTEIPVTATIFTEFESGMDNEISVRAVGGTNTFSQYGSAARKTYLGAPATVTFNNNTGMITWTKNAAANSYEVYINGSLYRGAITGTTCEYSPENKNFTVAVKAIGDGINSFSSVVGEGVLYRMLGTVSNLTVTEGVVTWDPVEDATGYIVSDNGNETTQTGCTYSIPANVKRAIKVKPIAQDGGNYFSTWSEEKNFTVLAAPSLRWNSNLSIAGQEAQAAVAWDAVTGVGGYRIKVVTPSNTAGRTQDRTAEQTFYSDAYTETGWYTITCMSIAAQGTDTYDSVWSPALKVQRLQAPDRADSDFIKSDEKDLTKGFTVSYKAVTGAVGGYDLIRDGQVVANKKALSITESQVLSGNNTAGAQISYKIRAKGGTLQTDDSGYKAVALDSIDTLDFAITVLRTPNEVDFSGDEMTWGAVSDAHEGKYTVRFNGIAQTSIGPSLSIKDVESGSYDVDVCARGDGGALLPSAYSNKLNLVKLKAPTNVRINTNESEGKLQWDPVVGATVYKVHFGNSGNTSDNDILADSVDNINQYISTDTVFVRVYAVNNSWNADHTVYTANSPLPKTAQQFTKLATATWGTPAFVGTELRWNAPDNLAASEQALVTYQIYDQNNSMYPGQKDTRSLDLVKLDAGRYTFRIKCIGDGTKYVNSDMSRTVEITKLATPEVSVENNKYVWYGVEDAQEYAVYVDGEYNKVLVNSEAAGMGKHYFTPAFDRVKEYAIKVVAVGDTNTSMDSKPCTFTQSTAQLERPEFEYSYDKTQVANDGNVVIRITKTVEHAAGYEFIVEGRTAPAECISADGLTCTYPLSDSGTYKIGVRAKGNVFDNATGSYENNLYYKDSPIEGGSNATQLILIGTPNVGSITVSQQGKIEWVPVTGSSNGYHLTITYEDGTTEEVDCDQTMCSASQRVTENRTKRIISIDLYAKGSPDGKAIASKTVTWSRGAVA